MQPLVQVASRSRIANAESLQAQAPEPLALGRVSHEDVKRSFFLDTSIAARPPLLNIVSSPRTQCADRAFGLDGVEGVGCAAHAA